MAVIIIVFLKYILTSVMKKINYFIHIYNITASNILFLFMAYPNCIQKITDRTFHLPVSRRSNNELGHRSADRICFVPWLWRWYT